MNSWIEFFKAIFHANTEAWEKTIAAWSMMFHADGRSDDEMIVCIKKVIARQPMPKFPLEILAALQEELRAIDQMAKTAREAFRLEYRPPVCDYCKDSGWVSGLPHLECVEGPVWTSPRWTMACTCCCDKGRRFNDHFATREQEPQKIMGFMEYTKRNPHFHAQMSQRALEKNAELAAHEQQHGPHPGRFLLAKVLARHQATSPEANFQNAGGHADASGEVEIQTDEHGEIINKLDW